MSRKPVWIKTVKPVAEEAPPRTEAPKRLIPADALVTTKAYDPLKEQMLDSIAGYEQTVSLVRPWFLMSGVGWLVFPVAQFKGYLSKFELEKAAHEDGSVELSVEITPYP